MVLDSRTRERGGTDQAHGQPRVYEMGTAPHIIWALDVSGVPVTPSGFAAVRQLDTNSNRRVAWLMK